MEYAINILKTQRDQLVAEFKMEKSSSVEQLEQKANIDKAIAWLETIDKLQWEKSSKYEIVQLPDTKSGYSNYRIMNDNESDVPENWVEFKPPIILSPFDYLIISK